MKQNMIRTLRYVKRRSTGVNALADVSDKLVSELEIGYQTLTTDPEQRKSYRLHFIINLVNILESAIPSGGRRPEDDELFSEHQTIEMEVDSNFFKRRLSAQCRVK